MHHGQTFEYAFNSGAKWALQQTQAVGVMEVKICTGCGRLSTDPPIELPALACCPDNHYLPIKKYWQLSAFPANEYQKK